ncbi:hypothetical protein M569_12658, partial [Genlisea aurea]
MKASTSRKKEDAADRISARHNHGKGIVIDEIVGDNLRPDDVVVESDVEESEDEKIEYDSDRDKEQTSASKMAERTATRNQRQQGNRNHDRRRYNDDEGTLDEGGMYDDEDDCMGAPYQNTGVELNVGLINTLPRYYGKAHEDPHQHVREFQVICGSLKMEPGREEEIKLQAFPFSLMDGAKDWFYSLDNGSIHTWRDMRQAFLDKYFPSDKVIHVRKAISSVQQQNGESLYDYWERYKRLLATCPKHQLGKKSIILYFYEGLTDEERKIINAAAGGNLKRKTADEAREIITMMANNSQQFAPRSRERHKGVHAVTESSPDWGKKIDDLTKYVVKAMGTSSSALTCDICCEIGHEARDCKFAQGMEVESYENEEVNA